MTQIMNKTYETEKYILYKTECGDVWYNSTTNGDWDSLHTTRSRGYPVGGLPKVEVLSPRAEKEEKPTTSQDCRCESDKEGDWHETLICNNKLHNETMEYLDSKEFMRAQIKEYQDKLREAEKEEDDLEVEPE